jgi:amino acid transporter
MTSFALGVKVLYEEGWAGAGEGWVQLVVYLGVTLCFTGVNLVACRRDRVLPIFNNVVGVWFVGLFFVFALALLISVGVKREMAYQPASFVFGKWINQTGWSDGVVWFLGLLQAAYGLTAFDSVVHMVEELPEPRRNAPRVIWLSIVLGGVTGFLFMVVSLFCIQDLDLVVDGPTGLPFMEIVHQTIGLDAGAALLALFIFNGLGQGVSVATTGSRLTWGFARDGGIPWSDYFAAVDATWKVPVRALWLQGVLIGLIGVLYLFADTVLQAVLSVATIALTISYGMPIACLLYVGRDRLPRGGTFHLGKFGWVVNWVSVVYCAVTTVFFFFPGSPAPSPADMNYAIAVFGVMLVVAVGFWFVTGSKTYLKTDDAAMRMELARRLELEESEVVKTNA